jgi:DHA2 family multidrug resistance protein
MEREQETGKPGANLAMTTAAVTIAVSMQAMDTHVASVALPTIRGAMSATPDEVSWILTASLIAIAVGTPPIAWLSRRYGRRRLFLIVIGGFVLNSVCVGMSTSLTQMVIFRALQGLCAAGLAPLAQQILLDVYPQEKHGVAMGWFTVGVMFGLVIGPTLGGVIVEYYDWRWVFLLNVPVALLAFLLILGFVPEDEKDTERHFDFFGFCALSIAIAGTQLILDRGEQLDWLESTEIIVELGIVAAALYVFVVHVLTSEQPFVNPALFRNVNFLLGLALVFTLGIAIYGYVGFFPSMMQTQMHYPALATGFVLAPRGFATAAFSVLAGLMLTRMQPRTVILIGIAGMVYSTWEMTQFTPDVDAFRMILVISLQGGTMGMVSVCVATATFATLTPEQRAEGVSFFNLLRKMGSSVGVSILVGQLVRNSQINRSAIAEQISPFDERFDLAPMPQSWDLGEVSGIAAIEKTVLQQAEFLAYIQDFWLLTFIALAMVPMALLLRTRRAQPAE